MKAIKHIITLLACFFIFTAGRAIQIRRSPGSHIPESILPTDRDNPALWTHTTPSIITRAAAPGIYALNDIPRTGTIEYPLVLVDFIDRPFTIKDTLALRERYNRMYNEQGYIDPAVYYHGDEIYYGATGSVSDYFRDQSYGQYIPGFKIIGPVHPSKGYAYYGKGEDGNLSSLVREICDSISTLGLVDLTEYTRKGNIDQLGIIYAGRGENYDGADPNTIWPQADILHYNNRVLGINKINYICTCELFWDSDSILDGIGTFCHEFSHTLGLPDFYNTSSTAESESNAALGFWSIMDYGNYENGGFSPVGFTAFEKYSLGWMDIKEIDDAGIYSLYDISHTPDPDSGIHCAYRLSTHNDDQFIILENHNKTGWYKYHASEGLMVTAVNYDNRKWIDNTVNNVKSNKCYYILPADNNYDRLTNYADLFPYQGIDSITTRGTPRLMAGSSYPQFSVYCIQRENSLISFYAGQYLPLGIEKTPENDISISIIDGNLSITAPIGSRVTVHDISGKTVYESLTTEPTQKINLPERGIWIVKCADKTRKVRN